MKARSRLATRIFARKVKKTKKLGLLLLGLSTIYVAGKLNLNPVQSASAPTFEVREIEIVIDKNQNIDTFIGEAVDEFLPSRKSEARMIMHCLAHRESGHGASNDHGDYGKAGGPFQFWNDTWERMRKQMIKEGVASEIGSRYDFKEAARTTAWALSKGREKEWGPILRESLGNHKASCPVPSWSK